MHPRQSFILRLLRIFAASSISAFRKKPCVLAVVGGLLLTSSCALNRPQAESGSTEWLPTLGPAARLEDAQRQEILEKCGVTHAELVWIRTIDLDQDQKEDCVVTLALPPENGASWRNFRSLTYVFRGGTMGGFDPQWKTATLWFSLVTYERQDRARLGDVETIRQFSVFRRGKKWYATIREHEYGNDGGEARDRLMALRRSTSWSMPASGIPPASSKYP